MPNLRDFLFHAEPGIEVYCGDCREVLPLLEPVDAIVTDPPYGIGLDYGHSDSLRPDRNMWMLARRLTDSLHMTVSNRHLPFWLEETQAAGFFYAHCSVYWNRCRAGGNSNGQFAYAWEPILHFGENIRLAERMLSDVFDHTGRIETEHPAERDRETWRRLIWLLPAQTILDPFMGSGTTLRVTKDLRRRAIGIEIEPRYCEIIVKRLRQEVLPL